MDYGDIRGAIENWIMGTTGLAAYQLFWNNRPRTWRDDHAVLRLVAPTKRGHDSLTYNYSATPIGSELTPVVRGNREVTVEVQVWSHNATDTGDAYTYTLPLVDSLTLPENLEAFKAAGLGFKAVLNQHDLDEIADQREMSVAQVDIRFHADAEIEGTPTTYVDQWGVESDLRLPDGTAAPQQIDENMP